MSTTHSETAMRRAKFRDKLNFLRTHSQYMDNNNSSFNAINTNQIFVHSL